MFIIYANVSYNIVSERGERDKIFMLASIACVSHNIQPSITFENLIVVWENIFLESFSLVVIYSSSTLLSIQAFGKCYRFIADVIFSPSDLTILLEGKIVRGSRVFFILFY